MPCVYILKLANNTYYTGYSQNLKQRLVEHLQGKCPSTRNHQPSELVCFTVFKSKYKALEFEKYLKTGSGQAFRNKRLV